MSNTPRHRNGAQQERLAIVTGFRPFGTYHDNPSKRITEQLDGARIGNVQVKGLVLPNEYDTHHTLMQFIEDTRKGCGFAKDAPVVVVSGGLSTSIHVLSLEAVGQNKIDSKYATDSGVWVPAGTPIEKGAPARYHTNADLDRVAIALREVDVPSKKSEDAGGFSCNSILFGSLSEIAKRQERVVFIYYHTAFTADDKGKIALPPEKIFMPAAWLEKGVPAMILAGTRQVEEMLASGTWRFPLPLEGREKTMPSHKDST